MAGYFLNPLVKKLEIKTGDILLLTNTPKNYENLIEEWPDDISVVEIENAIEVDFIHFFTQEMVELECSLQMLKQKLKIGGALWISWPKGTSKLTKDLNGNDVRSVGLENGLVDVKVCAIDEDWSGLKFVYRTQSRQSKSHTNS